MHRFMQQSRLVLVLMLSPAVMAQAQFIVQNGAVLSTNGNVSITLKDIDLIVDGTISQHAGEGTWFLTGSGNNTISGSGSPVFDKLAIAKTGTAKIILLQDISIAGGIDFTSGLLDLNNNHAILQSGARLSGESESGRIMSSGGGYIEASAVLNAPAMANPGNLGAMITSHQNLGNTVVRRGHNSQTNSGGTGNSIQRYYDILPANNNALDATLRISYLDAELNGLDESSLVLYKSTDSLHWANMGYTFRDASINYVEDSAIADFSRWTLSSVNNPLPVKFAGFAVECLDGTARITWQTAQEQNSSRFDIERSVDGLQWTTIGSLAAAGASYLPRTYAYVDDGTVQGAVFYRVAEYDLDGAATYTTTASAKCTIRGNEVSIYPNPVRDILWVALNTPVASVMKIEVFNAGGAKSYMQIATLAEGNNRIGIDTKVLSPGLYFLQLQWDNGHSSRIIEIKKD